MYTPSNTRITACIVRLTRTVAAVACASVLLAVIGAATVATAPSAEAASCGGKGQKACPALKKGPQCNKWLSKDKKGVCRPCGGRDKRACPALAKGPRCKQWNRKDKNDICRACGGKNQRACPVLAKGRVCKSGLKKKKGKCRPNPDDAFRAHAKTVAAAVEPHLLEIANLRACLISQGRKIKLKDAVNDRATDIAERIVKQCLTDSIRNTLRKKPQGLNFGTAARSSNANDSDDKFFNTLSIGVGAGGILAVGGAADAGVVIDLTRSKHVRIYTSSETAFGAGANVGADLIIGLGRDHLKRGKYKNLAVVAAGKFLAGGGLAVVFDYGEPSLDLFDGIAVSGGAGAGGEIGTIHKSQSRIWGVGCRDVQVTATNKTGSDVKILDLDYYDYERKKWRSKLTMNSVIKNNKSWKKTRRLKAVGLDETKIRIEYRMRKSDGKWGPKKSKNSGKMVCEHNSKYSVAIK